MKNLFLLLTITVFLFSCTSQPKTEDNTETENNTLTEETIIPEDSPEIVLIKQTIQTAYVEGLLNEGDFDKIDAGFHPDFELLGIGEGNEMCQWALKANGNVVPRRTVRPLKTDEILISDFIAGTVVYILMYKVKWVK